MVLHEHDDELIEVVRRSGRGDRAPGRRERRGPGRVRADDCEAQKGKKGGGRKGRKHALRGIHYVFSRRPAPSQTPVMLLFSPTACSYNRYGKKGRWHRT